jgi:DnaK suppressor protein
MVRSAVSARNGALAERRGVALEPRLSVLRTALEQQRDFRREQLAHVDMHQPTPGSPVTEDSADRDAVLALREVEALVAAGARQALADIEVALARMHTGRYGYCRVCGTDIPVVVLDAIPTTTVCLVCQQSTDRSAVEGVRDRDGWVSAHGPEG